MNLNYQVIGLASGLVQPGDDITSHLIGALDHAGCSPPLNGDIFVLAESMVATAEGRLVFLDDVSPSARACELADKYAMDPREAEVVLRESDQIVGGIFGFLLCMKGGTLLPNAGVDNSNAPPGFIVPLPEDPDASALRICREIRERTGADTGVIVADSRVHAMRSGCSAVAIGCAGIPGVIHDDSNPAHSSGPFRMQDRAVADMIASAAEIVMGEADECTPFALVRGLGLPLSERCGIKKIRLSDCIYMGSLQTEREEHSDTLVNPGRSKGSGD